MKISIIIPVFNEVMTVETLLGLVAKQTENRNMEVIVVESNSSDGSRQIVTDCCERLGFQLILQDRPSGKGNAVAAGLTIATGDILMIQDADLEYDLDDYERLLRPLLNGEADAVLGSRHSANRPIRVMHGERFNTFITNFGHLIFAKIFNLIYRTQFSDPFTMFKVFKRSALPSLTFECNRFDFDIELLAKLVRAGAKISEIPVSYNSRGFREGKKVQRLRDPFTWLVAIFRFRF